MVSTPQISTGAAGCFGMVSPSAGMAKWDCTRGETGKVDTLSVMEELLALVCFRLCLEDKYYTVSSFDCGCEFFPNVR